jgi:hypothetical protein
MVRVNPRLITAFGLALGGVGLAHADIFPTGKVFDITVGVNSNYQAATDTVTGGSISQPAGFTTVSDLFDASKLKGLSAINSNYTDTSAAVVRLGYRGLPLVFSTTNTAAVSFSIPALNFSKVFNAKATRDDNVSDLNDYLKSSGASILNQMQQLLTKVSPVDPLAGNPNSLQSQLVTADFDRSFTQFATNIKDPGSQSGNLIGVALSFGQYNQRGVNSDSVTLPLSYTFRSAADPGRQFTIYAPISVSHVEGAKSYAVNIGMAYRLPVNDNWALSPSVGYGVSGSADLGSAAAMVTMALTSQYQFHKDGYDINIGNSVGTYKSQNFSAGDYSFDPGINNTVLRNGVMVSVPTEIMGHALAYEASFINTHFSGSELYSQQYNELGLTIGTRRSANSIKNYLRAGITYLKGDNDIKGIRLNVGYWF